MAKVSAFHIGLFVLGVVAAFISMMLFYRSGRLQGKAAVGLHHGSKDHRKHFRKLQKTGRQMSSGAFAVGAIGLGLIIYASADHVAQMP